MTTSDSDSTRRLLTRPEGRVAYDLTGRGPLVVCAPGMGELRATYRFLAPQLTGAGYSVATTDLRGHGDSDIGFASYGDEETADDLVALVEQLGAPAVLVGNSMSAGSAVLVAARRPDLVSALVLLGPFVRNPATSRVVAAMMRLAMAPPWATAVWNGYLPRLYAGARPADFDAYRADVVAALRRPGYAAAFSRTTRADHGAAATALPEVTVPALVVMGERDPDFPDPAAEARWITDNVGVGNGAPREVVMVPEAGHYPQSQRPDLVGPAITAFLSRAVGAPVAADA